MNMLELCEATEDNPFIHGMSKQFVKALQQLFDVMDTESTGTIRYADLAMQWEEDQSDPLFPKGLITCLAKVTLPSGLLTFDRFCAGIKLCLLKNQVELKQVEGDIIAANEVLVSGGPDCYQESRPPSEPQVYAPPPPPSLPSLPPPPPPPTNCHLGPLSPSSSTTTTSEINNNTSMFNNNHANIIKNASFHSSSSFNASSSTNMTNSAVNLSDDLKAKKLPLPSYEQVMAAKSKSMSKLPLDNFQTLNGHHMTSVQMTIDEMTKFASQVVNNNSGNSTTKSSTSLYVKPPHPLPAHEQQQSEQNRRVTNLSLYENFALLSNESTRYPSDGFSQRAKSMTNLENIASLNSSGLPPNHLQEVKTVCQQPTSIDQQYQQQQQYSQNNQKSISSTSLVRGNSTGQSVQQAQLPPASAQLQLGQPKTVSRNCIIKTLQSWRDNILHKGGDPSEPSSISMQNKTTDSANQANDLKGKGIDLSKMPPPPQQNAEMLNAQNSLRRNTPKRREPRRHTVGANGIDLYTIKRFQQLEQEKDILMRGLNEIDKTKEWYKRQVACIQDKINFAGRAGNLNQGSFPSDCNIDAAQERINFQATRIQNLNQHLVALRDQANQSFPLHMNLAIRPFNGVQRLVIDPNQPKQLVVNPNLVNKLKEQNRLLTEEVSRKSERITQLEREKSSLIRELFQARTYSSYYNGDFDDTFM